jgi:hypothetical protein
MVVKQFEFFIGWKVVGCQGETGRGCQGFPVDHRAIVAVMFGKGVLPSPQMRSEEDRMFGWVARVDHGVLC